MGFNSGFKGLIQCPETKHSVMLSVLHPTNKLYLPLLCVVWSGDLKFHEFLMACKLWNPFFRLPTFPLASGLQSCNVLSYYNVKVTSCNSYI